MRDLVNQAYFSLWVAGEVQRIRKHRSGHLYFELVEKGDGDQIVGRLEAVIWRKDLQRVQRILSRSGLEIVEGQQMRCRSNLDFYPPFGRLQLVVREVDAEFGEGKLAARRRETLEKLAAAGLLDRNRERRLPQVPLRLALITSEGSAAYHDFLATLAESIYGFRVVFVHASVQGMAAERELISALRTAQRAPVDCAVMIRGGGSKSDLAVFDSRPLAEAIAQSKLPVLTGLGHEIDEAVADIVAHTSLKTPTQVAESLVQRVARADGELESVRRGISRTARRRLELAASELRRAERAPRLAAFRVTAARQRLARIADGLSRSTRHRLAGASAAAERIRRRLGRSAPRLLATNRSAPTRLGGRIAALARARLRESSVALDGWGRLCKQLSPKRTLERGFTMTRDASGRLVRSAGSVRAGERITTTMSDGELISRVEDR